MKELVEMIASALVDNPDEVVVTETETENEIVLKLSVAPADMGKVIGKQGKIAKAIRTVVRASASKSDKKNTGRHSVMTSDMCLRKCHKVSQAYFLSKGTFGSE